MKLLSLSVLLLCAALPSAAADAAPAKKADAKVKTEQTFPADAPAVSTSNIPNEVANTTGPRMSGGDPESMAYANQDFEGTVKADLKQMDGDLKEAIRSLTSRFDAETQIDKDQFDKRVAFRKEQRDSAIAFEKKSMEAWQALVKRLRPLAPADRAAEKAAFDQKAVDERRKFYEDLSAKSRQFIEDQDSDRQRQWNELQKKEAETRRQLREHETKFGRLPGQR
jgi:hypothetical protein